MTVLIDISLAVCYGAYILYLAILNCECELGNCSITVRSNCLLETVLAVLEVLDLGIVAVNLYRLYAACNSVTAVDLNAFKCLALVLSCKHECCLACRFRYRLCSESELVKIDNRSVLDCDLLAVLGLLRNAVRNCAYVCYEAVLYCECEL